MEINIKGSILERLYGKESISADDLINDYENCLAEKEQLREDYESLKENVRENYKQIPISEQVGICNDDFI